MRNAATPNFAGFSVLMPSIQKNTDHTQKAIIIVSHMTLVLDKRNTGVTTVARAAQNGWEQKFRPR